MSQQVGVLDITFEAAADLSAKQYYIVIMSAANKVNVSGANGKAIGILQNKPKSGEAAVVRVLGTSKVVSHDTTTIAVGDYLTSDGNGKAEEADADFEFCIGMALEPSAADDDIIEVLVTHFQYGV